VPQLDAIGIVCSDLMRTRAFYGLLGVEFGEGDDHVEATLPNGLRLMWDTVEMMRKLDPEWTQPQGHAIALAFECDSPKDVNETYARVTQAGFQGKTEPFDAFWGQRYATLLDPDGNAIDLFAALDTG
jgi:uncharacterized glyoxalase superfamily protein PhnB